jgi:hypothetical protein
MGTQGTLRDASTLKSARLGAERSLVQIQSPRFSGSCVARLDWARNATHDHAEVRTDLDTWETPAVSREAGRVARRPDTTTP